MAMLKPAVRDLVALAEATRSSGRIVFWYRNGNIPFKDLRIAWKAAGLPDSLLPALPAPETALRRALKALQEKRRLVRPLKKRGEWAVVEERTNTESDDLAYEVECQVKLNVISEVVVTPKDADKSLRKEIETTYAEHLSQLSPEDASSWLVNLAVVAGGVCLRPEGGGVYFNPQWGLAQWDRFVDVIRNVSTYKVYQIPAVKGDAEAMAAIIDSVVREAQAEVAKIAKELEEGDLKGKALQARRDTGKQVAAKIAQYEKLFGTKLPDLHASFDDLEVKITTAELALTTEDDK
ncbi:MAG: hypothetical protein A2Y38_17180 [Spirochaetes bacterium GWB1_59_5]|nr:MAG: hypothetical protein A2Y38_17180 [Spirochaetes bacterium GWB1_59_5]